jgi:hypothetical protein
MRPRWRVGEPSLLNSRALCRAHRHGRLTCPSPLNIGVKRVRFATASGAGLGLLWNLATPLKQRLRPEPPHRRRVAKAQGRVSDARQEGLRSARGPAAGAPKHSELPTARARVRSQPSLSICLGDAARNRNRNISIRADTSGNGGSAANRTHTAILNGHGLAVAAVARACLGDEADIPRSIERGGLGRSRNRRGAERQSSSNGECERAMVSHSVFCSQNIGRGASLGGAAIRLPEHALPNSIVKNRFGPAVLFVAIGPGGRRLHHRRG